MRSTGGGAGVHIGEGRARGISPDGKFVVVMSGSPPQLMVIPTGAGEARPIETAGLRSLVWGEFNADGSLVVVLASEEGRAERLYAIDMTGGAPRPISPEGASWPFAVSPAGDAVATVFREQIVLYPLDGSEPRIVEKARDGERVVAWSSDGKALFVCARGRISVDIARIEIATGTRALWHTIQPGDPAGIMDIFPVKITPDGERYVYGYRRYLSDLFVVRGVLA
jgi:Tol biopolymer transport system component